MSFSTKPTALILFSTAFILIGCAKAPSCSDTTVKKLVVNIAGNQIKQELFHQQLRLVEDSQLDAIYALIPEKPTYEKWSLHKDVNPSIKAVIDSVDQDLEKLNPQLDAIVVNAKNDAAKKSECGASLNYSNGETHQIAYSTQVTEDKQVLVQMRFLP